MDATRPRRSRQSKAEKDTPSKASTNGAASAPKPQYVRIRIDDALRAQMKYRGVQFRTTLTPQSYVQWLLRSDLARMKAEIDERRGS